MALRISVPRLTQLLPGVLPYPPYTFGSISTEDPPRLQPWFFCGAPPPPTQQGPR